MVDYPCLPDLAHTYWKWNSAAPHSSTLKVRKPQAERAGSEEGEVSDTLALFQVHGVASTPSQNRESDKVCDFPLPPPPRRPVSFIPSEPTISAGPEALPELTYRPALATRDLASLRPGPTCARALQLCPGSTRRREAGSAQAMLAAAATAAGGSFVARWPRGAALGGRHCRLGRGRGAREAAGNEAGGGDPGMSAEERPAREPGPGGARGSGRRMASGGAGSERGRGACRAREREGREGRG